jgi:hypothetical protein
MTFVMCGVLSALVSLIVVRARRSATTLASPTALQAETIGA